MKTEADRDIEADPGETTNLASTHRLAVSAAAVHLALSHRVADGNK